MRAKAGMVEVDGDWIAVECITSIRVFDDSYGELDGNDAWEWYANDGVSVMDALDEALAALGGDK